MNEKKNIVVIEDEKLVRQSLVENLIRHGFDTFAYPDAESAMDSGVISFSNGVIMDIGLPGMSGLEATALIKEKTPEVPVLMLTAYTDLEDRLSGLKTGADDYIIKPFFMEEVIARLKIVMKRYEMISQVKRTYQVEDLFIDLRTKRVNRGLSVIHLTSTEFNLLILLADNNGSPVPKEKLLSHIWKGRYNVTENTVEVYINFLRNKIDKGHDRKLIHTRPGFGYYLSADK